MRLALPRPWLRRQAEKALILISYCARKQRDISVPAFVTLALTQHSIAIDIEAIDSV